MPRDKRRHAALLRAVNVGGHAVMPMPELVRRFASLGLSDVSTYIQSGNVVFTTTETDTERLPQEIEVGLAKQFDQRGAVFVLSNPQLCKAAANNPLEPDRLADEQQCHLMYLSQEPDAQHGQAFKAIQGDDYRFAIHGKVLYYAYSRELAGHRLQVPFERLLGVIGTARTWKVVDKLIELTA